MSRHERSASLLGQDGMARLRAAAVAVFGLGGVGSYAAEALVRGGVGRIILVDGDVYTQSNLNRQLGATMDTLGRSKAQVMAERALSIDPSVNVTAVARVYRDESRDAVPFDGLDYIIDAIDMVTAKLEIITRAAGAGVPVISCMGTGNKLYPEQLQISDISKTSGCPLARVMRKELGLRGIKHLPVVWSAEPPLAPVGPAMANGRPVPGSLSFVPPVAGMLAAGHVIRQLCGRPAAFSG